MGHLEKRIIIGALGLVAVLLTVVIFKGLNQAQEEVLFIPLEAVSVTTAEVDQEWPANQPKETPLASSETVDSEATVDVVSPTVVDVAEEEVVPALDVFAKPTLYTIESGDTLGEIAERELGGVRFIENIKELNPGLIASNLRIGDTLVMPAKHDLTKKVEVKEAVANDSSNVHTVVNGDSLYLIADKYYPGQHEYVSKIVLANKQLLKRGEHTVLRIGWKLNLPE